MNVLAIRSSFFMLYTLQKQNVLVLGYFSELDRREPTKSICLIAGLLYV